MRSARGKSFRGSRTSPAGIDAISNPVNAYTSNSTDCENAPVVGLEPNTKACGFRKKRPAAMNMMIGTSLPIVKQLLTIAACLTPNRLMVVKTATTATMIAGRQNELVAGDQK